MLVTLLTAVLLNTSPHPSATLTAPIIQESSPVPWLTTRVSPDCSAGTVYDDGSFENRYTLGDEPVLDMVTRFDLPLGQSRLEQVCVCWTRAGAENSLSFDLLVYSADGPGGTPGELLTGLAGIQASGIPFFPAVAFTNINLSALGIDLPTEQVYIGPTWDALAHPDIFLCGDESGPLLRPAYASTDQGQTWTSLGNFFPDLKALGVRADFGEGGGGGFTCIPSSNTLCLNEGRFQVRMTWRSANNGGDAQVVSASSDDSGLFYFLRESNWEMLVKVLDGCAANGHYWVFFAAVTNVEYTLTVVDSETGAMRQYTNPLGVSSPAITDTEAFATCPP